MFLRTQIKKHVPRKKSLAVLIFSSTHSTSKWVSAVLFPLFFSLHLSVAFGWAGAFPVHMKDGAGAISEFGWCGELGSSAFPALSNVYWCGYLYQGRGFSWEYTINKHESPFLSGHKILCLLYPQLFWLLLKIFPHWSPWLMPMIIIHWVLFNGFLLRFPWDD